MTHNPHGSSTAAKEVRLPSGARSDSRSERTRSRKVAEPLAEPLGDGKPSAEGVRSVALIVLISCPHARGREPRRCLVRMTWAPGVDSRSAGRDIDRAFPDGRMRRGRRRVGLQGRAGWPALAWQRCEATPSCRAGVPGRRLRHAPYGRAIPRKDGPAFRGSRRGDRSATETYIAASETPAWPAD